MNTIFQLTTHTPLQSTQVGGKALSLMTMTRAGLPVPPGFVLTVDFFAPWIASLQATPEWQSVQSARGDALTSEAQALQALCHDLPFTPQQESDLVEALTAFETYSGAQLFAVRSSSPEEDLEGASFAGGYETTLGVTTTTLNAAIRHSFASGFDARVFVYKQQHGFSIAQPRIAVVVQQQVNADAAGVAVSLNPLNNCYDEAVINANYGLGESVVAGDVEPDVFIVDKVTREILSSRAGSKGVMVALNAGGGTTRATHPDNEQLCLSAAQVLDLTDLLCRVEAHYHHPVDVEWAFSDDTLTLLQARPITTYLPLPPEMVTALGEPKRLYANSTLIEQGVQEPLSVLGTDFLGYVLEKVGGPVAEGAIGIDGTTFTASGGYYMNVSYALMMGMENAALAPGSSGDRRVTAILDSIDMEQYTGGELPAKLKAMRSKMVFKALPMVIGVLKAYLRPARVLNRYRAALPGLIEQLETFSAGGRSLRAQALALTDLLTFFYGDHGISMILAAQLAQQRIQALFKQEVAGVQDHLVSLGISLPGNKTAEMGEVMYALAAADDLARYTDPARFLLDLDRGALSPDFTRRWHRYVSEFGMRCPGEIDPATPRPRENPTHVFEQLKTMSLSVRGRESSRAESSRTPSSLSFFEEARAKREAAHQALRTLVLRKGRRKTRAFDRLYTIWLTFGGYRETPKHYIITVVDLFRRSALEIAQRFVADGRLDTAAQIFDLTVADIDRALSDPAFDLRTQAAARSAIIDKMRRSNFAARILDSRGKVFFPPRSTAKAGELSGVPISPGVIQGRVKVLHSAREKVVLPGEILVARATDPGWTPLFINAKGIILEIGGALQHGAVVAREYGIPCVSGVDDATSLLEDGQLVEVDGSSGIVRVLDGKLPDYQPMSEAEARQQQEIEARREKTAAERKRKQILLRVVPLVLLPLIPLCVFVTGFTTVKLLMGQSVAQIAAGLGALWQVAGPYLRVVTPLIGLPIVLATLWEHRGQLKRWVGRQRTP